MTRLPEIGSLSATSAGWGFFLCTDKSLRTGRGGDYLALLLTDATGALAARVFDNVDRLREEFDAGEFVKVQGRANLFNGRMQFIVENARRVMLGEDSQDRRDGFRAHEEREAGQCDGELVPNHLSFSPLEPVRA